MSSLQELWPVVNTVNRQLLKTNCCLVWTIEKQSIKEKGFNTINSLCAYLSYLRFIISPEAEEKPGFFRPPYGGWMVCISLLLTSSSLTNASPFSLQRELLTLRVLLICLSPALAKQLYNVDWNLEISSSQLTVQVLFLTSWPVYQACFIWFHCVTFLLVF